MSQPCLFSGGVELANLLASTDLLHQAWNAVSDLRKHTQSKDPTKPLSVVHKVYKHPPNCTIIAFVPATCGSQGGEGDYDLVSSEELKSWATPFDFVCTKVNSSFSIRRSAVTIFDSLKDELSLLKDQFGDSKSLIIAGHSLGGSIASLFTLWLLDSVSYTATKRPLCITFGSPLLGDRGFQRAISERPAWNSCFFHVVSDQDPVPKISISQNNVAAGSTTYKPFGSFLLCSRSDCACLDEPESIIEVMKLMTPNCTKNQVSDGHSWDVDYGQILEGLKYGAVRKGISQLDDSVTNPLQAGIVIQLRATGILQQDQHNNMSSLITDIAKRERISIISKRSVFDPTRKLNDIKINMTYIEWYKKVTEDQGGYYDCYKNAHTRSRDEIKSREEIIKHQRILTKYWKKMVSEVEKMPQKDGASFRTRWLFSGTNYRRLVEPLDIADYYSKGNKNYMSQGRSEHYTLLEQWFNDDKPGRDKKHRNKACSLTEDSCFWAHVEEAIISCRVLKDGNCSEEDKVSARDSLINFEQYVMDLVNTYAVSREVFLPQSSFMQWWSEYCDLKGPSHISPLTDFMRNRSSKYE